MSSSSDLTQLVNLLTEALNLNNQNNNTYSVRIKEPDTYDGSRSAATIDSWIQTVERYANFHNLDDNRTGLLAITLLRGRADAWYRSMDRNIQDPMGWLELKRELIDFFRPENTTRLARDKLAALVQVGDLTDYINTFMNIKLEIPNMTEEEAVDKFTRGLRDKDTRAYVRQYDPTTLKSAIHTAMSYDTAHFENVSRPFHNNIPLDNNQFEPMELDALEGGRRRNNYNAGGRGGRGSSGSVGSSGPVGSSGFGYSMDITCYFCGKKGHVQRVCRSRNAAIKRLVDDPQAKQRRINTYTTGNKQGFR